MKNLLLFSLIITATLTGCNKLAKLTQFELEYDESVIIPSTIGVNLPFNIMTPDIPSDTESKFAVNNTRKDLISEINLTKLDLTLTSPSNSDLGFLKSIEIYISATGLVEHKIAWKNNIPSNPGNYLELETTDADLKEYIKQDSFKLRISTVTNRILTSDHHVDVHSAFLVKAKIF